MDSRGQGGSYSKTKKLETSDPGILEPSFIRFFREFGIIDNKQH
jgi:hypothetical protein